MMAHFKKLLVKKERRERERGGAPQRCVLPGSILSKLRSKTCFRPENGGQRISHYWREDEALVQETVIVY